MPAHAMQILEDTITSKLFYTPFVSRRKRQLMLWDYIKISIIFVG